MTLTKLSFDIVERLTQTKEKVGRREIIITDIKPALPLLLQRAQSRYFTKNNSTVSVGSMFLGFVGEYVLMKLLDDNSVDYEYDEIDYPEKGDLGWDFLLKKTGKTIDAKCSLNDLRSESEILSLIKESPLCRLYCSNLVSDDYVFGYYSSILNKHYMIGGIKQVELARYKEPREKNVYTPFMSRLSDMERILGNWL